MVTFGELHPGDIIVGNSGTSELIILKRVDKINDGGLWIDIKYKLLNCDHTDWCRNYTKDHPFSNGNLGKKEIKIKIGELV